LAFREKFFKGNSPKYTQRLMSLSSMPVPEKDRWQKILPAMNNDEISKFQNILKTEITDLADIYLQVLQRRSESRVFDYTTEGGKQGIAVPATSVQLQTKAIVLPDEIETPQLKKSLAEDPGDRLNEMMVLERLVSGANFVPDQKKAAMLEVGKHMPAYIIKDLQEVIIREGLRRLKEKKKVVIKDDNDQKFTLGDHKNVLLLRGYLSRFFEFDPEYFLETRMGNKYTIISDQIALDQYVDQEVELEGFKDENDEKVVLVNKIRLAAKKK
jgi:hypothetical protein